MRTTAYSMARSWKSWTRPARPAPPSCPSPSNPRRPSDEGLAAFRFAFSALIHAALIPTASLLIAGTRPTTPAQNIEVSLTDIPRVERTPEPAPDQNPSPKRREDQSTQTDSKNRLRQGRTQPTTATSKTLPPPPNLTASGPEKGSVASKAPAARPPEARRASVVCLAVAT